MQRQTVVNAVYLHPGLQLEVANSLTTGSYWRHVYDLKLHNALQLYISNTTASKINQ